MFNSIVLGLICDIFINKKKVIASDFLPEDVNILTSYNML